LEILQWLWAQPFNRDIDFDSLLVLAAEHGHLELAQWLVLQGADVFSKNHGALRAAINNQHLEVSQWLESQGSVVPSVVERLGVEAGSNYLPF
jgi:hypothetical protein